MTLNILSPASICVEPGVTGNRSVYLYGHDKTPVEYGRVELPDYLGGVVSIEAFDRSMPQDRLLRYLVQGEGATTKVEQGLNMKDSLTSALHRNPERYFFEYAAVMRGLSKAIDRALLEEQASGLRVDAKVSDFLVRVSYIDELLSESAGSRYQRQEEKEFRQAKSEEARLARIAVLGTAAIPSKEDSMGREEMRAIRAESRRVEDIIHQRARRQVESRRKELARAPADLADEYLLGLLSGSAPAVRTHQEAIAALDALSRRSSYLFPGQDLRRELIEAVRESASRALSSSTLVPSSPLGQGAYRTAAQERRIGSLRSVRHTTGNPPPEKPKKHKMIPVVPVTRWDSEL